MNKETYLEIEKVRLQQYWVSVAFCTGAIGVVALSLLDYLVTPERLPAFLSYRAVAASVMIVLYFLNRRKATRKYQLLLITAAVVTVGGMVEMMVLSFGGYKSTYYAGIIVVYVVVFAFVPIFSFLVTLGFAALLYAIYLFPILIFDSITDTRIFWNNNIFLVCIIAIGILSRQYNDWILLKQLSLEYDLSKEKDQLSMVMSRLSLVEENERRKVAMHLHDDIGQVLALAHMTLQEMRRTTGGALCISLGKVGGLIEQCIQYTRSLTFELSSPLLYELGLEAAIESFGHRFEKQHGIKCRIVTDRKVMRLEEEQEVVLFQCVREALTNVRKHSGASSVIVSLKYREQEIEIGIEDNGIGFNINRSYITENGGFGLFSLTERMKNIGGSIDISSKPGATRISLAVPLSRTKTFRADGI